MPSDTCDRFLFDDLDVFGALVRLGPVWQQIVAGRDYQEAVLALLGEMTAATILLAGSLKQAGRLTIQLRGNGPVALLVIDCSDQLELRAMAKGNAPAAVGQSIGGLLGDGQLVLTLDLPALPEPYQSIVPLHGETVTDTFESYLRQSDQRPSRLFLAASGSGIGGMLLQQLPAGDHHDVDGWTRVEALARTVQASELLTLPAESLLQRLFPQETLRLFPPRTVTHNCPEDWQKARALLRALGAEEVYATLRECGAVVIRDDLCNREYRFEAPAIDALFGNSATPE